MTTGLVMSITDELVAELEALYLAGWEASGEGWNAEYPGDAHETKGFTDLMHKSCAPIIAKLLAERAELIRDRERLNWLSDQGDDTQWMNILRIEMDDYETLRDAVDEIMRQES